MRPYFRIRRSPVRTVWARIQSERVKNGQPFTAAFHCFIATTNSPGPFSPLTPVRHSSCRVWNRQCPSFEHGSVPSDRGLVQPLRATPDFARQVSTAVCALLFPKPVLNATLWSALPYPSAVRPNPERTHPGRGRDHQMRLRRHTCRLCR
jgi:hypothetical protein